MIVAIDFKDGRIVEFDANAFTSSDAMRGADRAARNAMTEFDLRLDKIGEVGLRLDIYWHDIQSASSEVEIEGEFDTKGAPVRLPRAQRKRGASIVIATPEELEGAARVMVYRANQPVQAAWRQGSGDWIINGAQFDAWRVLTYTDARTTSLNAQAAAMFRYIKRQNPALSDGDAAALMGYPYEALVEIMDAEIAQALDEGPDTGRDGADDEGTEPPERDHGGGLEAYEALLDDVPLGSSFNLIDGR